LVVYAAHSHLASFPTRRSSDLALLGLGTLLSNQVRDGIFDDRAEQILADAASRAESAQERFDSATANSTQAVQQLANDTVRSLQDRKSTRLNSSHVSISYAVFC